MDGGDVYYAVRDSGRVLGYSPGYVRLLIDRGVLPAVRTSRGVRLVRLADLLAFKERKRADINDRLRRIDG